MNPMNILRTLAATVFCLTATSSFAALTAVNTKVHELSPREWGFHFNMDAAAAAALTTNGLACPVNGAPVFLTSKPDYKTTKDAIVLAYTLNKTLRVYFDTTPPPGEQLCLGGNYPRIYAIDVLEN